MIKTFIFPLRNKQYSNLNTRSEVEKAMQWYSDKRLLTDQDMTTTGDNIDYSVPKWKQAMSVNTNPSH